MFVLVKSQRSWKMAHVGSKTRSLCQILEKPCVCFKGLIFELILMKFGQNVCLDKISDKFKNGSNLRITVQKAQVSDSRAIMALLSPFPIMFSTLLKTGTIIYLFPKRQILDSSKLTISNLLKMVQSSPNR